MTHTQFQITAAQVNPINPIFARKAQKGTETPDLVAKPTFGATGQIILKAPKR